MKILVTVSTLSQHDGTSLIAPCLVGQGGDCVCVIIVSIMLNWEEQMPCQLTFKPWPWKKNIILFKPVFIFVWQKKKWVQVIKNSMNVEVQTSMKVITQQSFKDLALKKTASEEATSIKFFWQFHTCLSIPSIQTTVNNSKTHFVHDLVNASED